MIIRAFDLKDLAENFIMKGIKFRDLGRGIHLRFTSIQEDSHDNLRVDLQTPPDREGGVCENREKRSESARGLGVPKVIVGERRTIGRDKCPKVFCGIEWRERRAKRHVACAVRARTRGARVNARRQVDRESRVEAKELALIWVEEKASFAGFVLQGVEQSMKGELRTGHQNSVICIFDVRHFGTSFAA